MSSGQRDLGFSTAACHWGQTLYGECYPFSYVSNIPFQLRSGAHYTVAELIPILSDARFVNYSVTLTTPGQSGQRIVRASKVYSSSFRLLYWNAYEKYRPGNRVSNERISPADLMKSISYIMSYELQTQELEFIDDQTQESVLIFLKSDVPKERFIGIDAANMFNQGAARGRRAGL